MGTSGGKAQEQSLEATIKAVLISAFFLFVGGALLWSWLFGPTPGEKAFEMCKERANIIQVAHPNEAVWSEPEETSSPVNSNEFTVKGWVDQDHSGVQDHYECTVEIVTGKVTLHGRL